MIKAYFEETIPAEGVDHAVGLAAGVDLSSLSNPPLVLDEGSWQTSRFASMDPHMKAFMSINVKHAMHHCIPLFFEPSMTARQALELLARNNFLSAPLRNAEGLILGFVDVIGLLGLLLANETFGDTPQSLPGESLGELIERSWLTVQPPSLVRSDDSLYRAIEMMSLGHHRLLVTDPHDNTVVGLITQSDIVQILNRFPILLGLRATETIAQSRAFSKDPLSAPQSSSVLSAIGLITKNAIPAIAILDANHHLVGSFSANSVKGFTDCGITSLHNSVASFFALNPSIHTLSHLDPTATLFQAIHLLAEHRAHRIWVANLEAGGLSLKGLLSITQLFRSLIQPV